ncbi:MAG: DegT/DnrJ/EryC1/StrS family aminotransferase [Kiritimatiellae bacterium]|nr:DegT/DnrJ/EryC1/StrS family aminotransferase [Kiritimatiellia bacterium]
MLGDYVELVPYSQNKAYVPVAEDLAARVLTLPTYYGLSLEDVRAIAENVREIAACC